MSNDRKRYRFVLLEQPENRLPVRYRSTRRSPGPPPPSPPEPMAALAEALSLLDHRGTGFEAWAPSLAHNPIAFVLDAVEDAVILREAGGKLLYCNRAARRLPSGCPEPAHGSSAEPLRVRKMPFAWRNLHLVVEIIHYEG